MLLLVLLTAQITLGALTVLSWNGSIHYVINSLHVVTGASVLVTSLVLTLRAHRSSFAAVRQPDGATVGRVPPKAHALEGGPAEPTRTGARA
jgi:hypothetical protein